MQIPCLYRLVVMLTCMIALLAIPTFALAIDPTKENPAERLLEEEQRRQAEEQLKARATGAEVEAKVTERPEDEVCVNVQTVNLEQNTLLAPIMIETITAPYANTCIGKNAINEIVEKLTKAYVDAGYITSRVYIPKQNLQQSQQLRLVVIQGTVEKVDINENDSGDRRQLYFAMPLSKEDFLNLRDIEQGIDQLNKAPSTEATMKLWPGEETGTTRVAVTTKTKDASRGFVAYDNNGSETTGLDRIRIGLEFDNLLDITDQWSLFYIGSLDTNSLAFSYRMGLGYYSLSYSQSYSEFRVPLTAGSELFGQSNVGTLGLDKLVYRDAKTKINLGIGLTIRDSRRFINDVVLTPQKFTNLSFTANYSYQGDWGLWLVDGGYQQGIQAFGAQGDSDDIAFNQPRAQFQKISGGGTYLGKFSDIVSFRSSIRAQFGFHALFGSEQINIGDRSTVRGYINSPASGDTGYYWKNDWTFTLTPNWLLEPGENKAVDHITKHVQPYVFVDLGWVYDRASVDSKTLSGAGFGLRYSDDYLSFDAVISRPFMSEPSDAGDGTHFYASATFSVF